MVILVLLGWVSRSSREGRGYAIVGIFILAAVMTPPDVVSQLMLAIPMCLLYEAGHTGGHVGGAFAPGRSSG
jgi:sec-independent protein translocase protein TatC